MKTIFDDGIVSKVYDGRITYTYHVNQIVGVKWDADKCPHNNSYMTSDAPDSKMFFCYDCNNSLDEDYQIIRRNDETPY